MLLEGEQREGLFLCPIKNDELDKIPIESLNLKKSLAGQQTNFCETYEVKAAHSDSSLYGKLPLLYSSDFLSQASRLKDGHSGSHEKVGDEVRIGANATPVDFAATSPQVHTQAQDYRFCSFHGPFSNLQC